MILFKKLKNFFHINRYSLLLLFIGCLCIYHSHVINEYILSEIGWVFTTIYHLVEENFWINVFCSFMVIIWFGNKIYDTYKDQDKSINRRIVYGILAYYLYFHTKEWNKAESIIRHVDYIELIGLGLLLLIIVYLGHLLTHLYSKRKKSTTQKELGFIIKTPKDKMLYLGWENYLESLCERITNTDLSEESFAVGVTGEWGSGKTTFIDSVKSELKNSNKFYVIEFNPWNSQNPDQIISDFFNTLIDNLKQYYSGLGTPINQYVDILTHFDNNNWVSKIGKFWISKPSLGLESLKKKVEECIVNLNKPVAIFIDDMDRLEKEETFEVLRLIRNTAQFKNIVYIVAYDRKHIEEMLHEKGIISSHKYIDKIFPLEIVLPKYETDIIPELLVKILKELLPQDILEDCTTLLNFINTYKYDNDDLLISKVLKNFRDVNRFSNNFVLSLNTIKKNRSFNDFNLIDLLIVELIYYAYPIFYKLMKDEPNKIFLTHTIIQKKISIYKLSDNNDYPYQLFKSKMDNLEVDNLFVDETLHMLLIIMFSNPKDNELNHIYLKKHYLQYFAFRLAPGQISDNEFNKLIKNKYNNATLAIYDKYAGESIISKMIAYETNRLSYEDSLNYLKAFISWVNVTNQNLYSVFTQKMKKTEFNKDFVEELSSDIHNYISSLIQEDKLHSTTPALLTKIYSSVKDSNDNNDSIFKTQEIRELVKNIFMEQYENSSKYSFEIFKIDVFFQKDTILNNILISSHYYTNDEDRFSGENLLTDEIISIIKEHKEFNQNKLMDYFSVNDNDNLNSVIEKICIYFGSIGKYVQFIKYESNIEESTKRKYLERFKLNYDLIR